VAKAKEEAGGIGMTEEEWLADTDLEKKVQHVYKQKQTRKLRLFSCGCCRQLAPWIKNDRLIEAIERAEKFADGELGESTLDKWRLEVNRLERDVPRHPHTAELAVYHPISTVCLIPRYYGYTSAWRTLLYRNTIFGPEFSATAPALAFSLFRDIFGNPFRPVAFEEAWRTDTVLSLARQIYQARDFSVMPILADALQDAGCDNDVVLNHCRDEKLIHVRGCWLVDLVLNKS
jgi:hypothetical protein